MRVGTAWEDITPNERLPLLGQMSVRIATRTRDPLTVNAVVFESGETCIALLSIDVCVLPIDLVGRVKDAIAMRAGLGPESVVIAATHCHVAPCTSDRLVGEADPKFLDRLCEASASAVKRAVEDLEPVDLFSGTGWLDEMGWNRRGMRRDGSCHMNWGSWKSDFVGVEGPRDGEVGVLFARRADGSLKAIISSFSTHPNCVATESFYSADLPGEVRRTVRAVHGPDVGVVYLTGAAGDTSPNVLLDNPENIQPWRGETGLRRSGAYLGGEILRVISATVDPLHDPALRMERSMLEIPIRPWDEGIDISEFDGGMREFFEHSRADWDRLMREESPMRAPVTVLRVGDTAIACNPGELFCAFGRAIKARSPARHTLISELTDGWVGYVPTPEAVRHGGYSAQSSGVTTLVPEAGWRIVDETERLLAAAFA